MTPVVHAAFVDPCAAASPACRAADQAAILLWRTQSGTTAAALKRCRSELAMRAPMVIREIVAAETPPPAEPPAGPGLGWVVGATGVALVVGVIVGFVVH